MNNSQVAHLWANQSKPSAKGSNFYFEGDTIYSYGYHFPIARIYGTVIFRNSKSYSISTSKHQSIVRSSIDYSKFTCVEIPDIMHEKNIKNYEYLELQIKNLKHDFSRSRKYKACILERLEKAISDYKFYCKYLKFKVKKSLVTFNAEKYQAEIEAQRVKAEIANKKKLEKEKVYKQLELNKFLNNDENIKTVDFRYNTNFLKIVGEKCITDNGAEVELTEVKSIINTLVKYNIKIISGQKIGNFTVNNHDETGIKIGCHFFDTQEINRIIELFK